MKLIASRGWCKPGTSRLYLNITSKHRPETTVGTGGFLTVTRGAYDCMS